MDLPPQTVGSPGPPGETSELAIGGHQPGTSRGQVSIDPIRVGIWFALLTGFGEAAILMVRRFLFGEFVFASVDVTWAAPVAVLAFYSLPILALTLGQWLWPGVVTTRVVVVALSLPGLVTLLAVLENDRLHWSALILLVVGLGVQVDRKVRAHEVGFARLVRRTVPALAALVLLFAAAVPAYRWMHQRRSMAAAPAEGTPNILLIILDTVRAANLGLYGYDRPTTPNLDRFARRGVVFERAFSTASWTLPGHASIFTGRLAHDLTADWLEPLDDRYPTLAEVLRDRGYETVGFTSNYFYTTRETGLARGFSRYESRQSAARQIALSTAIGQWLVGQGVTQERISEWRPAEQIAAEFLDWLDDREGRPFFAFVNFFDAHADKAPPSEFFRRVNTEGSKGPLRYDAAINYVDHELGRILGELERRGLLHNTIVAITSDHGELFREHGIQGHGHNLYFNVLNVPLVVSYPPSVPGDARIPTPVSTADLPATLAAMAFPRTAHPFPGGSLERFWAAGTDLRESAGHPVISETRPWPRDPPPEAPLSRGRMFSVVREQLHYICNGDGKEELYDIARDPAELHNLAGDLLSQPAVRSMRSELDDALSGHEEGEGCTPQIAVANRRVQSVPRYGYGEVAARWYPPGDDSAPGALARARIWSH